MCECLKRDDGTWHVDLCCADIMDAYHQGKLFNEVNPAIDFDIPVNTSPNPIASPEALGEMVLETIEPLGDENEMVESAIRADRKAIIKMIDEMPFQLPTRDDWERGCQGGFMYCKQQIVSALQVRAKR